MSNVLSVRHFRLIGLLPSEEADKSGIMDPVLVANAGAGQAKKRLLDHVRHTGESQSWSSGPSNRQYSNVADSFAVRRLRTITSSQSRTVSMMANVTNSLTLSPFNRAARLILCHAGDFVEPRLEAAKKKPQSVWVDHEK